MPANSGQYNGDGAWPKPPAGLPGGWDRIEVEGETRPTQGGGSEANPDAGQPKDPSNWDPANPEIDQNGRMIEYDPRTNKLKISCGTDASVYETDWDDLWPDFESPAPGREGGDCDAEAEEIIVERIVTRVHERQCYIRRAGCWVIINTSMRVWADVYNWQCHRGRWTRVAASPRTQVMRRHRSTRFKCTCT
ncbi:MAG: hypothetical protein RIE31_09550 [Alphaproteobacteria bacterium]